MSIYWRRLKVITHGKEQTKIATVFLFWFVVFTALLTSIYFLRYAELSNQTENMLIHDRLVTQMLLVSQAKDLALWYGGTFLIFSILLWVYMLVYMHRLTGPIYKLQKLLEKCTHNRSLPDSDLRFRKGDGFHSLADQFNAFVHSLKNKS